MFPSPNVINNRNLIWWASHRIPSSYYTSRTKYDYKIGYLTSYCPLKKETGPASETRRFENTTRTTIIVQTSHRPRERPSGSWHLIQLLGSRQNDSDRPREQPSGSWHLIQLLGSRQNDSDRPRERPSGSWHLIQLLGCRQNDSDRPREQPSGSWHLIQLLGSRQNATGYSSKWEAIRFIGKKTRWMDVGQCHDCNRETKTTQCDCSSHLWGWVQCETVYSAGLGTGKTGPCRRQKL